MEHPVEEPKDNLEHGDAESDATSRDGNDAANLGETFNVGKKESVAVWSLRAILFFVFVSVACAVCLTVYIETKNAEEDDFEEDYIALAITMVEGFYRVQQQRTAIVRNFAMTMTSDIKKAGDAWPMLEIPDFAYKAKNMVEMGSYMSIATVPIVQEDEREEWENFAYTNRSWYQETVSAITGVNPEDVDASELQMPKTIVKNSPNGLVYEDAPGPYQVFFQLYPATPVAIYNMNYVTHPHYKATVDWVLKHKLPSISPSYDFTVPEESAKDPRKPMIYGFLETYEQHGAKYMDDPITPLIYPVFDRLEEDGDGEIVAMLFVGVYWRTYFREILPSDSEGIIVVLENTCGQQYTYRIEGQEGFFVGRGDLHNPKYDSLSIFANHLEVGLLGSIENATHGNCFYTIRVYPSESFEDHYMTDKPLIFALSLAGVFVFTATFFLLYDHCVNRRHRAIERSARRSHNLVSSLFPEDVRDRLYEEQEVQTSTAEKKSAFVASEAGTQEPRGHAIATLYPACTVLFADIVGFTNWSSSRSPTEVFELLETIYGVFDGIANRLGVTKIETIGDCYVAVAGLPEPRADHASIMVKFADRCHTELIELVHGDLADRLGTDTRELTMRFGLHSGPVTAGVLRGQKSRFQMFGDTVNTASRMESTGKPDCIHVSADTAILLERAGKKFSLCPREDVVVAKGKGEMQTYWVSVLGSSWRAGSTEGSSTADKDDDRDQKSEV